MHDIATRPQSAEFRAATGIWFDWSLAQPGAAQSFPWTDFTDPSGEPQAYAELLEVFSLELEPTFHTAIIVSWFTDARADDDDVLPAGVTDRRGWVGDEFVNQAGDATGSKLWLYYFGKKADTVLEDARYAAQQAARWMVSTGMASRVEVTAEWRGDVLVLRPQIFRPGKPQPVYDVLWATSVRRGVAA